MGFALVLVGSKSCFALVWSKPQLELILELTTISVPLFDYINMHGLTAPYGFWLTGTYINCMHVQTTVRGGINRWTFVTVFANCLHAHGASLQGNSLSEHRWILYLPAKKNMRKKITNIHECKRQRSWKHGRSMTAGDVGWQASDASLVSISTLKEWWIYHLIAIGLYQLFGYPFMCYANVYKWYCLFYVHCYFIDKNVISQYLINMILWITFVLYYVMNWSVDYLLLHIISYICLFTTYPSSVCNSRINHRYVFSYYM